MTNAPNTVFVFGLAVAGRAVAKALATRGMTVSVGDDSFNQEHRDFAREIGAHVVDVTNASELQSVMSSNGILAPAPGVPENHFVIRSAREHHVSIQSEIEIAYRIEQHRPGGSRPMVAVTGTD